MTTMTDTPVNVGASEFLPYSAIVFLGYLTVAIPLPVIPIEVQAVLHYKAAAIGMLIGCQSLATVVSRQWAGSLCDRIGAKRVSSAGIALAVVIGFIYAAAMRLHMPAALAFTVMVAGRLLLGIAESMFITATLAWSISRVGLANSGRAMAWNGMAMYGAVAIGAPLGTAIYGGMGFIGVCAAAIIAPLCAVPVLLLLAPAPISGHKRQTGFLGGFQAIWAPGLGIALASMGFGTIAAFLALRYDAQGWGHVGYAMTGFGVAYILVRLLFTGLPDRLGGRRVVMPCLVLEAVGLLMIWQAPSAFWALAGATITGAGYSLVFPSLGVEAVRHVDIRDRAMALGAFLACFDLGLAGAGPIMGTVANVAGLPAAFLGAAGAVAISLLVSITLLGRLPKKLPA